MKQQELFPTLLEEEKQGASIPGFWLQTDYITSEEEQALLAHVDAERWETDYRRRIQQYGLGYAAEHGEAPVWLRDFPDWLIPLAQRVSADAKFERFAENCVVNEYIPPLGIGSHRDYGAFGPTVACVSLASDIVMDFTSPQNATRVPVYVPARSLWVITGEARSKWLHGIAPRLTDVIHGERRTRSRRVSVTFRTGKERPTQISPRTTPGLR
jgi:alkylated DNA repair protein alkB family protein 8